MSVIEVLAEVEDMGVALRFVKLIRWNLKSPPVAIETCVVVTDPALFARTTLEQLRTALAQPQRWVGWSVTQLIDRLAQVGVLVMVGAA
jgi:hypothetical protein